MPAYYNEHDAQAAQWLRNLIAAGLIAPGDVDERSIVDVRSDDLRGYTQAHFFAGIGVWSYSLRLAGWDDGREAWTGSCPCQPFSAAGKRAGKDDERHLWPEWFRLIRECRPAVIFGEQVASTEVVGKQQGEAGDLSEEAQEESPREGLDSEGEGQGNEESGAVRSGFLHGPDSGADRREQVRDNRTPVQSGRRADVGQPIVRSDQPEGRIHLRQHSRRLPCDQRGDERLGRAKGCRTRAGDPLAAETEVERIIAAFRRGYAPPSGWPWLDDVRLDLERSGYAFGSSVFPACSVGAPHIRNRLYFVADAEHAERRPLGRSVEDERDRPDARRSQAHGITGTRCEVRAVADDDETGCGEQRLGGLCENGDPQHRHDADGCGAIGGVMGDATITGCEMPMVESRYGAAEGGFRATGDARSAGATNGFWRDAEWIACRDGKARAVEPGTFPLAHGAPARVVRLRAYGNAIVAEQARAFIEAYREVTE